MSLSLTETDMTTLQERLNRFRAARVGPLNPIPVSGRLDQATKDAIRCCQHEHNSFFKTNELSEDGVLDTLTASALEWWDRVLTASDQS